MIPRNGVRSTLRARGRTALFTLLIFVLTLALTLGLGMWGYCVQTLAQLDQNYTSIALLEYVGSSYPDPDAADPQVRAAAQAVAGLDVGHMAGVELWEPADTALASLAGYDRAHPPMPYRDHVVVEAIGLTLQYEDREVSVDDAAQLPPSYWLQETCQLPENGPVDGWSLHTPQLDTGPLPVLARVPLSALFHPGEYRLQDPGNYELKYIPPDRMPNAYILDTGRADRNGTIYCYVDRAQGLELVLEPMPRVYPLFAHDLDGLPAQVLSYSYTQKVPVGYNATANRILYAQRQDKPFTFQLDLALRQDDGGALPLDALGFDPQWSDAFLLHGTLDTSYTPIRLTLTELPTGGGLPFLQVFGGKEDPALTQGDFAEAARFYSLANNYVRLEASDDVAALEPFQQGALTLTQGRFPGPGEPGVCVVDGLTAQDLALSPGDRVELQVLASDPDDRGRIAETGDLRTLTVVGVTNPGAADTSGRIWVSRAEGDLSPVLFGCSLGRAVLDNAAARRTAAALQDAAPDGVVVTLYDQGYSTAAQPIESLRTTALAVTLSAAAGALAVLVLFAYLFVGRQRETVAILTCLGTPRGKVRLWLLSGAGLIAAVAALLGAAAGGLSLGTILDRAMSAARTSYAADLRYSDGALGVVKTVSDRGVLPAWPAPAAALAVLAAALLLCLLFLGQAQRRSAPKRGKLSVRVPRGGTSTALRGPVRFALLSAKRGGWRSTVVPAASLTLALLLGLLATTAQGWESQLQALAQDTRITVQATSTNGRQFTGLQLPASSARTLAQSGLAEDFALSKGWHYWFADEIDPKLVNSVFSNWRDVWIARQPNLVAVSSLAAATPGAFPAVTWLPGWDETCLAADYPSVLSSYVFSRGKAMAQNSLYGVCVYPCIVGQGVLDKRDLRPGDVFSVQLKPLFNETQEVTVPLQVVGVYSDNGSATDLYLPLAFWGPLSWTTSPDSMGRVTLHYDSASYPAYFAATSTYSSLRFTVRPGDLEELRDFLEERHFSRVGRLGRDRTTLLIRDRAYVETVNALGRYITFSRLLFPVLYLVVGLLGFVISWLMVNARRMEFAILRGLGASRGRVFWSFFLEQAGLCLLGCLLGGLVLTLAGGGPGAWPAVGGFLLCYLAGCALSVLAVGRTHLMSLLSERE